MTASDIDLDGMVTRYQANELTYDDVYERVQHWIRYLARQEADAVVRLRPYYDTEDYESILREVLWRALKGWAGGRARFGTYFLRAARYELRHAVRRETARCREGNYNNVPLNEAIGGGDGLSGADQDLDCLEFLDRLSRLPLSPNERLICTELLAGYKQREIAGRHGWTEQYVSVALRRLRAKFRAAGMGAPGGV